MLLNLQQRGIKKHSFNETIIFLFAVLGFLDLKLKREGGSGRNTIIMELLIYPL
jgi:hypothetical protein